MGMLFGTIIWIILTVVATYYVSKHVEERSEHCTPEGRWNNQKYIPNDLESLSSQL